MDTATTAPRSIAPRRLLLSPPAPEAPTFLPQDPPEIGVYDGDTPVHARSALRDCARLLITNPDMLHLSILPNHPPFARFLSGLRYVVIDEAHAYRGAFGSHTALVLRRLRRICGYLYGARRRGSGKSGLLARPPRRRPPLLPEPSGPPVACIQRERSRSRPCAGGKPQFFFASATVLNPVEHAQARRPPAPSSFCTVIASALYTRSGSGGGA